MPKIRLHAPLKDEKEGGSISAKGTTGNLATGCAVTNVTALISMRIRICTKRCSGVAEICFELCFAPECDATHRGVQAIGSYDQIEAARRRVPETHPYLRLVLLDRFNAITKDGLNAAIQFAIDPLSKVSTQNAKETVSQDRFENVLAEAADPAPLAVNKMDLLHLVTCLSQLRNESHSLGDIISDTPEIRDVSALAQSW